MYKCCVDNSLVGSRFGPCIGPSHQPEDVEKEGGGGSFLPGNHLTSNSFGGLEA